MSRTISSVRLIFQGSTSSVNHVLNANFVVASDHCLLWAKGHTVSNIGVPQPPAAST